MPDLEISPTLHKLINRFQVHRCYYTKLYKHNGKFYKKCRFGFLRPEKTELELHNIADCLAVNKPQPRKWLHRLSRTSDCIHINDCWWQTRPTLTYNTLHISGLGCHITLPTMSQNMSDRSRMRCGRTYSPRS